MPIIDGQEKQPIVAICYDFDKTLSPDDMQAQGFIQSVGYDVAKFWEESFGKRQGGFRKRMIWMATLHICIRWCRRRRGILCSAVRLLRNMAQG